MLLKVKSNLIVISKIDKKFKRMKEEAVLNKFTKERLKILMFRRISREIYLLVPGTLKFQIKVEDLIVHKLQTIDPEL